jgi:nitrogen fixation protein NifB
VNAERGTPILLDRQLTAIEGLKKRGLIVKVNTIIIPGVNDGHIEAVAAKMAELNVDILNCAPYYPNRGSAFEHLDEPSPELVRSIRAKAEKYIKQMRHCTRCRADAVGLLGEAPDHTWMDKLQACGRLDPTQPRPGKLSLRPNVAVASMEGVLVNQHLGRAAELLIYGRENGAVRLLEARRAPEPGGGDKRWEKLAEILSDCQALLVNGVGDSPRQTLSGAGIDLYEIEGLIDDAVDTVLDGGSLGHMRKRTKTACDKGCAGTGAGCG